MGKQEASKAGRTRPSSPSCNCDGRSGSALGCELCGRPADVFCAADEASLCAGCDARVHSANFLVARHVRRLLCRSCGSPTRFSSAGPRIATALSCHRPDPPPSRKRKACAHTAPVPAASHKASGQDHSVGTAPAPYTTVGTGPFRDGPLFIAEEVADSDDKKAFPPLCASPSSSSSSHCSSALCQISV